MKLILALVVTFSLSSAFAAELLKIKDGSLFACESMVDVLRSEYQTAYVPKIVSQNDQEVTLSVSFVKCVKNRNGFKFEGDEDVVLKRTNVRDESIKITREDFVLVVTDVNNRLLEKVELTEVYPGKYLGTVSSTQNTLISVSSKIKIVNETTGAVIDDGTETLGTFKLVK